MGEIKIKIDVENAAYRMMVRKGTAPKENEMVQHTMDALVDTGCVMLVLPQDVVEKLDLDIVRKVVVIYADERKEERDVAGPITLHIGNRSITDIGVVGPPLSEPLIGQIILEELDLIADCQEGVLRVRPESPIYPCLKMK